MNWQPIATVPKDGKAVLVFLEEELFRSRIHAAVYRPNVAIIGTSFAFDCPKATHWMPLPPPPTEEPKP